MTQFDIQMITNLVTTLHQASKNTDEVDPTFYYSIYHLRKYYNSIGNVVPEEHRSHILAAAAECLKDDLSDYCDDNDVEITIEEYIPIWAKEDLGDAYGGNGAYNFYMLERNGLKEILRMFVQ